MPLDGAMLNILTRDWSDKLNGARVEKVNMPYRDCVILHLSSSSFKGRLLISCNPNTPRIQLTEQKYENPATPPMVCMLLRKKLTGARIRSVRQLGLDRVVFIDFDGKNELGDNIVITAACELVGRLANIIFIEDGKIIESVRRFDPLEGKRFVLPGARYEPLQRQDKLDITVCTNEQLAAQIDLEHLPPEKAFQQVLDGVSPLVCRELAVMLQNGSSLEQTLDYLRNALASGGKPTLVYDKESVPLDYSFIEIKQYGSLKTTQFEDYGALMDAFYGERERIAQTRAASADILKLLSNLSSRIQRKIAARQKDLKKCENREQYREYGELIKSNLHLITPGDSYLDAVNYYDPECGSVRIKLDPALSASKNAQKYFKDYRKKSTAAGMLNELISKACDELEYIDSVFDALTRASTTTQLEDIKLELSETGYLRLPKKFKKFQQNKSEPLRFVSSDGFTILAGRNNKQNDLLTLKIAEKTDLWLHTKNIPGSHVIIVTDGIDPPEGTIRQAAVIAAKNSKAAHSQQVPVDYALVKYVKKSSGAKPGKVIYTHNKTVYVDPSEVF